MVWRVDTLGLGVVDRLLLLVVAGLVFCPPYGTPPCKKDERVCKEKAKPTAVSDRERSFDFVLRNSKVGIF